MARIIIAFLIVLFVFKLHAQPTQTLRGVVLDEASNTPVPYATVVLLNTQPLLGATTDTLGNFTITKVPVGRYDVKVSCMGYNEALKREITVGSAKQTVLIVTLKENANFLNEVTVKPTINKENPLNNTATVSARMLSVDEAKRYAGGFDDPARLASAFAGVAANSGVNGIIVRGNAPKYLQWKMEGVEIANPNHFGDLKAFGGGILTGLSSQMLANSDFLTGAFPAEYNNALSGVFDIAMRTGNQQEREHTFQVGLIGIETSSEGPFKKGGKASYLYNYRNSTLELLAPLLPENANSIRYQDLSFKLHFPTRRAGVFTVWGIGLSDGASANPKQDSLKWLYKDDRLKNNINFYTGSVGLSHQFFIGNKTYIKTNLAATAQSVSWKAQSLNDKLELIPYSKIGYTNRTYVWSSYLNKKFSARHTNKMGFTLTGLSYNINLNKAADFGSPVQEVVNAEGFSTLLSAYSNSTYQLTGNTVMNVGINTQWFTLNGHYTVEPRIGLRRYLGKKQSLGIAYGLHSRIENLNYYFNNSLTTGEQAVNKKLDFTKAHHFVLSYDNNLSNVVHLKVETYLQRLFDVPVMAGSSFSFLNLESDWFFAEKLQNTGEGLNYGVDVTLEKYMSKGYYYMLTASLFDAQYKGGDGVWRSTRFNRNFVVNALVGKEWQVGKNKQNVVGVNARAGYQGGNKYAPVDEAASFAAKDIVYDNTRAFSRSAPNAFTMHFTVSYRKNKPKSAREVALKIVNLTGHADFYGYKYNYRDHTIDKDLASVVLPNLTYRIEF